MCTYIYLSLLSFCESVVCNPGKTCFCSGNCREVLNSWSGVCVCGQTFSKHWHQGRFCLLCVLIHRTAAQNSQTSCSLGWPPKRNSIWASYFSFSNRMKNLDTQKEKKGSKTRSRAAGALSQTQPVQVVIVMLPGCFPF